MLKAICPIFLVVLVAFPLSSCGDRKAEAPAKEQHSEAASKPSAVGEERIRTERLTGDLGEIIKRRYLRVLVVPDKMTFFFDGSQLRGAVYEAMREFEATLNKKLNTGKLPVSFVFIPVRRNEILEALAAGRGDVAAARLPVTPDGKKLVDFSDPVFDKAEAIVITGPGGPDLSQLQDLAGKQTLQVSSAAARELLGQLNARFRQEGKPELKVRYADENLEVDDVLEMVNAGLVPLTITERSIAELWAQVFENLRLHPEIVVAQAPLAWAVRKDSPQLLTAVNDFVKDHKVGTSFGSTVLRRYLKNTKWVKNSTSAEDIAKFRQMIALFQKYGDKYDFPHLLLAAQAYQESGLNNNLRNPSGAVGVLQIKPTTAAAKPIEIPDVTKLDRNIEAGVKYLRFIMEQYYKNEPMDRINKGLFVIASYNAGPNKIRQLRDEATAQGFDRNRWFNNVEVIASQRIGRETVQYVSNIFKYYLAYELIGQQMSAEATAKEAAGRSK